MPTDLDDLIAQLAAHLAHSRNIRLTAAERTVRKLVDEAWSEYQELGAPLGDDDAGLARWIVERSKPPPTA
jgi:hypothetical protein